MKRIEYRTIDKSQWGEGPWQNEPDKIQWQDEETGYPCLIHRSHMGFLCGYVGLQSTHPLYGQHYDKAQDCEVHGGLTYGAGCMHTDDESHGICHKPEAGEPDNVWWLGFDCGHIFDFNPYMEIHYKELGIDRKPFFDERMEYRDIAYVTSECQKLAKQLKAMEK